MNEYERQIEAELEDQAEYLRTYPHANVLSDGPNRSYRPFNYSALYCAALAVISALIWMFAR